MAKLILKAGSTSVRLHVFIQDSSSTTGAGLTGLVYNSSGLTCYYARPGSTAAAVSLVTQTVTGAYSSGGFVEIDATNMPGWYRLDVPNAVLASGVLCAGMMLRGATNMAPLPLEIQLTAQDFQAQTFPANFSSMSISGAGAITTANAADVTAIKAVTDALPTTISTVQTVGAQLAALV